MTKHPIVGHSPGVGPIGGLEIVADEATRKSFAPKVEIGELIEKHARKNGIILRITLGRIAYSPPLIITEQEIAEMGRLTWLTLDGAAAEAGASSVRRAA